MKRFPGNNIKVSILLSSLFMMTIVAPCICICAEVKGSPTEYTLSDLYQIAAKNAEEILVAHENLEIATEDRKRALSVIIPRLTAFADYTDHRDTDATFPQSLTYGVQLNQSFTVNGRELTALKIADDQIQKNQLDLVNLKEEYLLGVASAYYGIWMAIKALDISRADVKRLTRHKEAVRSRFDLGDVTKTAMTRASAELAGSASVLVKSENDLKLARARLSRLVKLPPSFTLTEPECRRQPISYDLHQAKQEALRDRSDLKALEAQTQAAQKQIKWAKGAFFPALSLEGKYFDLTSQWSEIDPVTGVDEFDADNIAINLQLTFTLFDGGLRQADLRQAESRYRQAMLVQKSLEKEILLMVESAFLDLVTLKSMLSSLEEQLKFSQENYMAVTEQFAIGMSNSIDVMDANTLLVKAEREFSDARFRYLLAELNLLRAKGSFMNHVNTMKVEQ